MEALWTGRLSAAEAAQISPLALAYLGDTIYDLFVRMHLVGHTNARMNDCHAKASSIVCAHAQAEVAQRLSPHLTAEERAVFKRGRNAKSATIPKNASVIHYRAATGLEALVGYLFLSGQDGRLDTLMTLALAPYLEGGNES